MSQIQGSGEHCILNEESQCGLVGTTQMEFFQICL